MVSSKFKAKNQSRFKVNYLPSSIPSKFKVNPKLLSKQVSFIEIETDEGHDSFLLDEPELDLAISGFLNSNYEKIRDK